MIRIKFEPRDLWIGVYWNVKEDFTYQRWLNIYVCIIPMFPIIFTKYLGGLEYEDNMKG